MPKQSKTLRDFSKGLNTESALTDVDDKNLTRSVGVSIERPGVLRLLGKANANVIINNSSAYKFKDDNDNIVSFGNSSKHFDPGHGLYAFSHSHNYGERSAITDVVSKQSADDGTGQAILANTTYVTIADTIGASNDVQVGEVDFQAGDIVRIYNKNYSKELNNRYFQISSTNIASNRVYLKLIKDGEAKNFCLVDEGNNRVAAAIIDTHCTISSGINTTDVLFDIASSYSTARHLFAAGDYIKIDDEVIKISGVSQSSNTNGIAALEGRSQLGTTAATHSSGAKIYKYTYGPDHSLTWSGGGLTGTEDGYIEKVPQRNFTKYIACQNSELINLFVNDTSNHRTSTTFLREEVMDLKNNHDGSSVENGIGLTNFGPTTQLWPKTAMLPDISFASNALRASPSNKIGLDDTNYMPRWLGHINKNTMFGVDDSNTYINEWYYDTASIKKPSNAIESNVRSSLGYQSDYAKSNEIGTPWGHNWFSANYLNGYHDNNEISALSKFQECQFWEREGYEDSSGNIVEKEIDNDNDLYNISAGDAMIFGTNYESGGGSQFRGRVLSMQKDATFPANGTDSDNNPAYSSETSDNLRYIRLAESNYKRSYNKVATLTNGMDITDNDGEYLFMTLTKSIWIGQFIIILRKEDTKKLFCQVRDIEIFDDYQKVYLIFGNIDGTFEANDGNFGITSFNHGDEVYDASRMEYTKPIASSELLKNNSGKGYLGAYQYALARTYNFWNNGSFGSMAWSGYDGASPNLSWKRATASLAFESDSEEEAGAYGRAITSITRSGNTITVTTNTAHGLSSGDAVTIYGSTNYNHDAGALTINKVNNTSFTAFRSDFSSGSPGNETYSSSNYAVYYRYLRGLPSTVITKDESLDGENFIYHNSVPSNNIQYDLSGTSHIKNILRPDTDYYVTYTCRNFYATGSAKFRMTLGQGALDTDFDSSDTRTYHDIDGNAYKTTVLLRTPSVIKENYSYVVLNISTIDNSSNGNIGSALSTNTANNRARRTMLGDLSVVPVNYSYGKTNVTLPDAAFIDKERSVDTTRNYLYPSSFLSIGYEKYKNTTNNWSINAKGYDFYVSYLFDGGQTPQESTPKFMKKISVSENNNGGDSFRFSVSLCYSSLGDVLDMCNKRMTGARVYFKESELQESTKLYALLDIDFVKGVRKSSNENFVPWAPDFQNVIHYSDTGYGGGTAEGDFTAYDAPGSRPYSQVKPANEGSHVYGYFKFDAPPRVLEWGTLNSSNPFEKGDFYAQYKTSAILKGKRYIGNLSIRPDGINQSTKIASKVYENYPNAIIASEEGCYDKFPYESGWVNLPIDIESSPIVKLESYLDFLVIHKELSTHILNFKEENKPILTTSLSNSGIKWRCQSIVTNSGVFWINNTGCYFFNGEKVVNLIKGKISQDSLGWPNNQTNLYYWDIKADNLHIPSIGYDEINSQLLVISNNRAIEYKDNNTNNLQKDSFIWIYDLESQAWTTDTCVTSNNNSHFLKPYGSTVSGYRSNIITESGNDAIFLEKNFLDSNIDLLKWSNSLHKYTDSEGTIKGDSRKFEFQTKQLDFGNPHTKKRIHQIYVTYRLNTSSLDSGGAGDIDTDVEYSTDGGNYSGTFDTETSTSYESSFSNTSGNWATASLVPSVAIDCYTFALKISSGTQEVPFDFEINDITFVYRSKRIKTKARD